MHILWKIRCLAPNKLCCLHTYAQNTLDINVNHTYGFTAYIDKEIIL